MGWVATPNVRVAGSVTARREQLGWPVWEALFGVRGQVGQEPPFSGGQLVRELVQVPAWIIGLLAADRPRAPSVDARWITAGGHPPEGPPMNIRDRSVLSGLTGECVAS
jgi:hypothetical protein